MAAFLRRQPALYRFSSSLSTSSPLLFDLRRALDSNAPHTVVWGSYTALLAAFAHRTLPLEVHQEVLRRCAPPPQRARKYTLANLDSADGLRSHRLEYRFQAVMRNIAAQGGVPSVEDYHVVLKHFAATGHYRSSFAVLKELCAAGRTPDGKTIGLCMQAMAFRLRLPGREVRPDHLETIKSMFQYLMEAMNKYFIPWDPINLNLCLRILKETGDMEGFESLVRLGYGIDLSNPDRVALEYSTSSKGSANRRPPKPFPFTTTVLNTLIDAIGRTGNISKLVQTFEVLTQPLRSPQQYFFDSFDSHEEDDFGVQTDLSEPPFPLPSAPPNTTTYSMLIRHISTAGHHVLARHYLLQAMHLDRTIFLDTLDYVANCQTRAPIPAPAFACTRDHILPVFGLANRDKNVVLLRWLADQVTKLLKRKQRQSRGLSSHRRRAEAASISQETTPTPAQPLEGGDNPDADYLLEDDSPSMMTPPKPFRLAEHLELQDLYNEDIEALLSRIIYVHRRSVQRKKEFLGRRVWQGKDIFLAADRGRSSVDRETWERIVNFREDEAVQGPPPVAAPIIKFKGRVFEKEDSGDEKDRD